VPALFGACHRYDSEGGEEAALTRFGSAVMRGRRSQPMARAAKKT
jgi:hypothetical protein